MEGYDREALVFALGRVHVQVGGAGGLGGQREEVCEERGVAREEGLVHPEEDGGGAVDLDGGEDDVAVGHPECGAVHRVCVVVCRRLVVDDDGWYDDTEVR